MDINKLQDKIKQLERIKSLSKEKYLFKAYKVSKLDKEIMLSINSTPINKIAKKLGCHRSYIYNTLEKFKDIYTKEEVGRFKK